MKFIKNKTAFALILGGASALLLILLAVGNVFNSWQLSFADNLYSARELDKDIVIVKVDDKSLSADQGLGNYDYWDRNYFAKMLENINKFSPKVVAFDFYFQDKKTEDGDQKFQKTLSETKNPIIIYRGNPSRNDQGIFVQKKDEDQTKYGFPYRFFLESKNVVVAYAKGMFDADGNIRRMIPAIYNEFEKITTENFAFAVARAFMGGKPASQLPKVEDNKYVLELADGKSVRVPLEDGQMIVNYMSVPKENEYQQISFIDVYKENYQEMNINPDQLFKDKIVLIGPTDFSFKDYYGTPTAKGSQMSGIFIHANALQTILEQKFLRNLTLGEKSALIIFLALTAAFTFMFTKIRWSLLYLFGVPAAYWFAAKPMFDQGIILDLVHPYLTVAVTFIAIYLYRYVTEFKEKLELQSAFGKYVNPTLVKQIAEHPEDLKLGGETREVTVMFTDIVHSSALGEKLKPESLVALLNEYFEAMSEVIMAEGGTVDKFEGDGIMAFFGAPIAQADHALRAARAALNMRIKLNEMLEKWKTADATPTAGSATPGPDGPPANLLPGGEPKPPLDFRCGLSSGEVIVGNIGSMSRFNYTVMGDIVNLGSRLEGANKKYGSRIMMSQKTHELIKDQFETRELDIIQVVGKTEPVKVFELLAPKGQLPQNVLSLLQQYNEAIALYHNRKFAEALAKFTAILQSFPEDGPSQLYRQRCEVLRDFPPKPDWNGVFEMGSK